MESIEEYRFWKHEKKESSNPSFKGKTMPQMIGFLAKAYERLNAIERENLPLDDKRRIKSAMNLLSDALLQMDINIGHKY